MNNYGFYGKITDGNVYHLENARRAEAERYDARGGGCLAMVLMVIGLSAGFSAALLSMLSSL